MSYVTTTINFEFQCGCGYIARNKTEKGTKLMEKLHSKKCDKYEGTNTTFQNEYTLITNSTTRTRNLVFDSREEFDRMGNRFLLS